MSQSSPGSPNSGVEAATGVGVCVCVYARAVEGARNTNTIYKSRWLREHSNKQKKDEVKTVTKKQEKAAGKKTEKKVNKIDANCHS